MKKRSLQKHRWLGMILVGGLMLTAGTAFGQEQPGAGQGKAAMPDAQVESNVLRQLASAPELSAQNIKSTCVYGVVTLSGNVQNEALRTKADNLVARAAGVKKVVDELTIGDTPAAAAEDQVPAMNGAEQGADPQASEPDPAEANNAPPPPPSDNGAPDSAGAPIENGASGYGQPGPPPPPDQSMNGYAPAPDNGVPQGGNQRAGLQVVVPSGTMLQIRINRGLDANHVKPGTHFDGTVLNDVVADGAVAIPRGAQIQGDVVDAKKAGTLKGHAELALELTSLTLGGQNYPLTTVPWSHEGRDKTISTVNRAVGLGALGALFGAAAGGGAGAAIGAGIGGAAGVASSASSPRGRVIVPPESMLTFHLAQPAAVTTVSQQEMGRLAYAAGSGAARRPIRHRYYSPYGGPAY